MEVFIQRKASNSDGRRRNCEKCVRIYIYIYIYIVHSNDNSACMYQI